MHRTAYVDDKLFAAEFRTGDTVRKSNIREFILTPFVGRVLFSNTDTGKVSVQWPWGAEQEDPTMLVKSASADGLPPGIVDTSYDTWEKARYTGDSETAKSDAKWRTSLATSIVDDFNHHTSTVRYAAQLAIYEGMSEETALNRIASVFGEKYGNDAVASVVADVYEGARRFAIYRKDSARKYQVSRSERAAGHLRCPRCAGGLKNRTYRHGQTIKQCRECGFSIANDDLVY